MLKLTAVYGCQKCISTEQESPVRLSLAGRGNEGFQLLLENKGKVVSRETLMERLWATDSFVDENTLTVNVTRLRKKLEAAGLEDFITTRKGMGYICL